MLRSSPPLRARFVAGTDWLTDQDQLALVRFQSPVPNRVQAMETASSDVMPRDFPKLYVLLANRLNFWFFQPLEKSIVLAWAMGAAKRAAARSVGNRRIVNLVIL